MDHENIEGLEEPDAVQEGGLWLDILPHQSVRYVDGVAMGHVK